MTWVKFKAQHPIKYKYCKMKSLAKARKIKFTLSFTEFTELYIKASVCPILGVKMSFKYKHTDNRRPELDRIVPSKGYCSGNCQFISRRANRLKDNMTLEECVKLYRWFTNGK